MRLTIKTIINRGHPNGMDRRKATGRIQETRVTIRAGIITDRICSEMEKFNCFLLRIHITSICNKFNCNMGCMKFYVTRHDSPKCCGYRYLHEGREYANCMADVKPEQVAMILE